MHSKIKFITALLFISSAAVAQTKQAFSVQQAVDYGIKNSVTVKNALLDIKIQQQTNREFTANAYPQISGSASGTHYFSIPVQSLPNFISPATYDVLIDEGVKDGNGNVIKMPDEGFGTIAARFGVPWVANAGIDFSQILFDGQVFVGLQARATALKLSEATAAVTTEQIKASIQKVYYQLVVGQKQLGSIEANIDRFEKLLHDTKEIFKNGFAEKLDVDKVQVQLNQPIALALPGLRWWLQLPR